MSEQVFTSFDAQIRLEYRLQPTK